MNREEGHIIDELQKRETELPGDAYFSRLKAEVLQKIQEEQYRSQSIPLYRATWFQIAAAASVVLIVTLFVLSDGGEEKASVARVEQPDWNSVSQEEMLAYIHENIDDFDTETIAGQLDSVPQWNPDALPAPAKVATAPRTGTSATDKFDELFRELDADDILEYLEEEGELEEDLLF